MPDTRPSLDVLLRPAEGTPWHAWLARLLTGDRAGGGARPATPGPPRPARRRARGRGRAEAARGS